MAADPPRLLLLRDDEAFRYALVKALRSRGYEVHPAARGLEAVELASQYAFDMIITDVRMEGMDGLEALSKVKEAQPDVQSMVVTGYSSEDDSIRAIRLGVNEYLKKPFRVQTFVEAVRAALERKRNSEVGKPNQESLDALAEWGAGHWAGRVNPGARDASDLLDCLVEPLSLDNTRVLQLLTALHLYGAEQASSEGCQVENHLTPQVRELVSELRGGRPGLIRTLHEVLQKEARSRFWLPRFSTPSTGFPGMTRKPRRKRPTHVPGWSYWPRRWLNVGGSSRGGQRAPASR